VNKRKRVAWHKHLAAAKKLQEKRKAQRGAATATATTTATKR